jgi:hypothetical protein
LEETRNINKEKGKQENRKERKKEQNDMEKESHVYTES